MAALSLARQLSVLSSVLLTLLVFCFGADEWPDTMGRMSSA